MKTFSKAQVDVLVVGAGIGGLTLAGALARRGLRVRVWERAEGFEPVGAGISLQPNAWAVLEALGVALPPEAMAALGPVAVRDARGRALLALDAAANLASTYAIHRADLHTALLAFAAGVPVEAGAELTQLRNTDEGVTATAADGRVCTARVVVGADGVASVVGAQLDAAAPPVRLAGQTCWRLVVPGDGQPAGPAVEQWAGDRRIGRVPLSDGRWYLYLVASERAAVAGAGVGEGSPDTVAALARRFAGIDARLDALLAQADPGQRAHRGPLGDRPRARFGAGPVLLLGDAAHASTPNLGQGAALAIEDAGWLALHLPAALAPGSAGLGTLATRYAQARTARVEAAVRTAWRLGWAAHWRNRLACWLRDVLLRALPARASTRQAEALWQPGLELAAEISAAATGGLRAEAIAGAASDRRATAA